VAPGGGGEFFVSEEMVSEGALRRNLPRGTVGLSSSHHWHLEWREDALPKMQKRKRAGSEILRRVRQLSRQPVSVVRIPQRTAPQLLWRMWRRTSGIDAILGDSTNRRVAG